VIIEDACENVKFLQAVRSMVWAYTLMCLIYGTTFLAIRAGDDAGMPPFLFAALRFAAAGLMTLGFVYFRNKGSLPRRARTYWDLALVGFFNTTAVFAIVYYVEQFVPSGYAALMGATMPFLVVVIERVTYKQTITVVQCAGLLSGFAGVLAIAWPGIRDGVPHWLTCTVALLVAEIAAAIGAVKSRRILDQGTSPIVVNGFQVLFGSGGLFVLAAFTGDYAFPHLHSVAAGLSALLYLTVFGSMVAATLYFWLVKRAGTLLASTWTYVSPVIAVVVGHLWYREPMYTLTIVGTVLILSGVFALNFRGFRDAFRAHVQATGQARSAGN
jgi:drug/metabolite transporter (DMT)-like permease